MKSKKGFFVLLILNIILILVVIAFFFEEAISPPEFSIGIITDCQYSPIEGTGIRKYALSENKLKNCISHFNQMNLEFVIHLGDFIDTDFANFDVVKPIFEKLRTTGYHVLGNHDFAVEDSHKAQVVHKLGMPKQYYDFVVKGWRFVVLDGNDISFHAHPENTEPYQQALAYYQQRALQSPRWNGAIGAKQLSWLESVLENAAEKEEKVILFCHFPVYPDNEHNLWNARELIDLIEPYTNVKIYINGHNHAGNYGIKNGIHYVTLKGMVDTQETAYAVVHLYKDRVEIAGFGRESNRRMNMR